MPKFMNKPSIIQNGLSREECEAFFELMQAAEYWRETMVRSNAPVEGYPEGDPDGVVYWSRVSNHNGRLVQAVDNARMIIGRSS